MICCSRCRAMRSAFFGLAAEERYVKRVRIFQTCNVLVNSCEIRTGPPVEAFGLRFLNDVFLTFRGGARSSSSFHFTYLSTAARILCAVAWEFY